MAPGTRSASAPEAESGSEPGSGSEPESESGSEPESESGSGSEPGSESEAESGSEAESEAESGSPKVRGVGVCYPRRMAEGDVEIREEAPGDVAAVRRVQRLAFESEDEPRIVDDLRSAGGLLLSLVAVQDGVVVGHIAFSVVRLDIASGAADAVGLGPVAVLPERQRRGIGAGLVEEGLTRLRNAGHGVCFVLGHASYYPRFGFAPAHQRGYRWEQDAPPEAFMLLELERGALPAGPGVVRYRPEIR